MDPSTDVSLSSDPTFISMHRKYEVESDATLYMDLCISAETIAERFRACRITAICEFGIAYIIPSGKIGGTESTGKRKTRRTKCMQEAETVNLQQIIQLTRNGSITSMPELLEKLHLQLDHAELSDSITVKKHVEEIRGFLRKLGRHTKFQELAGTCCMDKTGIRPLGVTCAEFNCGNIISPTDASYCQKGTQSDFEKSHRLRVCEDCFKQAKLEISIRLKTTDDSDLKIHDYVEVPMLKTDFKRYQRPESVPLLKEPTVECIFCRRSYHAICVMYDEFNWQQIYSEYSEDFHRYFYARYVCKLCLKEIQVRDNLSRTPIETVKFTPERMIETKLSSEMQNSVLKYIGQHNIQGLELFVREVSSGPKEFEAMPYMKKELDDRGMPSKFMYLRRTFMLFVKSSITKIAVPSLCLIVGEYVDSKWITINYVDSLKYNISKTRRTGIFHEFILGYIKTAASRGFSNVFIWACPATQDNEFVFSGRPDKDRKAQANSNSHPIPGLIKWCEDLLTKGIGKRFVESYRKVGENHNPWTNFLTANYFDGDYFATTMETILSEHYAEVESVRPTPRKSTPRKKVLPIPVKKSINARLDEAVKNECRGQVFMVKLTGPTTKLEPMTPGPDVLNPYFKTRDVSIHDCMENLYDFGDLRCSQYTSMKLCARSKKMSTYKCLTCSIEITSGLYCWKETCYDSKMVFCSYMCAGIHSSLLGHTKFLREFVTPYHQMEFEAHPVFCRILEIWNNEHNLISKFMRVVGRSSDTDMTDDIFGKHASGICRHNQSEQDIYDKHYVHPVLCWPCVCRIMFLRHAEFCNGLVCGVPGHAAKGHPDEIGVPVKADWIFHPLLKQDGR